jgi:hypothetical protein
MTEKSSAVSFEARRLARAPGWYVRVEWPSGKRDHVPGFVSQDEALRWIDTKGEAWASDAGRPDMPWNPPFGDTPAHARRRLPRMTPGGTDFALLRDARH